MLEIKSLSVAYAARAVLHEISLEIHPGEVVALIGPNGAGKSTLIKAISGVAPVQSGAIYLDGYDLLKLSPGERARRLAVVPQARSLPVDFSVWQTVLLGRTPYLGWLGKASSADRERVWWALEQTHLTSLADRQIGELSGGEQQRVLLARAVAQDTPVLLLDEPTAHLDLQHQSTLLNLARSLAIEGNRAVFMALHDLNLAALYADRVALLVGGHLRALGLPVEVLTPDLITAAYEVSVHVVPHPDYGTPLILPDGRL